MNVYLIEDDGGVTVFDAGDRGHGRARSQPPARASAGSSGSCSVTPTPTIAAPRRRSSAPVYCHPAEREAAESADLVPRLLGPARSSTRTAGPCSGAAARRPGTVARSRSPARSTEGDEVAGFRVVDLPGHAPGLIGLFRDSDRLALVSDCFYTIDPQTGRKAAGARSRTRRSTPTSSRRAPRSASSPTLEPVGRRGQATPTP